MVENKVRHKSSELDQMGSDTRVGKALEEFRMWNKVPVPSACKSYPGAYETHMVRLHPGPIKPEWSFWEFKGDSKEFKVENYWFCLTCCSCWKAPPCVSLLLVLSLASTEHKAHVKSFHSETFVYLHGVRQTAPKFGESIWATENVNITWWLSPFHEDLLSPAEY